jgi:hypothetical protein
MSSNEKFPLIAELEAEDQRTREEAAYKLLRQRLQNLQKLDEHRAIDLNYLTCAEYQLFIDEKRSQDKYFYPDYWHQLYLEDKKEQGKYYFQPDHWTDFTFTKGQSLEPITGVRGRDAAAFCEWLNSKLEPGIRYRLPFPDEAKQYPATRSDLATWCFDGDFFILEGLDEQTLEFILQQLSSFVEISLSTKEINPAHNRDDRVERAFGFDPGLNYWNYQRIEANYGLRAALKSVLGLFYGYPGRDLAVATNYDMAHAQDIAHAYKVSRYRILNDEMPDYRKWIYDHCFRLAGYTEIAAAADNIELAQKLLKNMAGSEDVIERRWAKLLGDFVNILHARNWLEFRQAYRHHTAHLAQFAYIGYGYLLKNDDLKRKEAEATNTSRSILSRFIKIRYASEAERQKIEDLRHTFLDMYWQMQILIAREEGQLSTWEGIRLICERDN